LLQNHHVELSKPLPFDLFPILHCLIGVQYNIVQLGANVQNIFANSIRELIEDYGMSFEEAEKQVKF